MKKIRYTIKDNFLLINKSNIKIASKAMNIELDEYDLYKHYFLINSEIKEFKELADNHNKLIEDKKFNKKFKELLNG